MSVLSRFRPYPVAIFAAVTLLIWGNRVWLAWTDPDLDMTGKLAYSVPITAFVIAAVATLGLQAAGRTHTRRFRVLVAAFAGATILYWGIRLPVILLRDHSVPFKVVHAALAVASMALALNAWRAMVGLPAFIAGKRRHAEDSLQRTGAASR